MKSTTLRCLLFLALTSTATGVNSSTSVADDSVRMLGLAMHQETGRNIYLGAIYVGIDAPNPGNLLEASAPKTLEYRIVARRTSIRSLLGNMLLQSEVATGHPPSAATATFADKLLSAVKGSFYAGDSFEITQDEDKHITAQLNGLTLVQSEDDGVFDYILMGWIGESGPSTAFRESILRVDTDASILAAHSAHTPSDDRIALIASWSASPTTLVGAQPTAATPIDIPAVTQTELETGLAMSLPDQGANPVRDLTQTASLETESRLAEILPDKPVQSELLVPESAATALVDGQDGSFMDATVVASNGAQSLAVSEYSHRLASFNTTLIELVYSEIQYPRRAVRREIQGALELDITMLEDGSLIQVAIGQSSGHSILDGAAVKAAEKAFRNGSLGEIDPVAIAEYGDDGNIVIPVPVNFILQ
jgi:TonB family protein